MRGNGERGKNNKRYKMIGIRNYEAEEEEEKEGWGRMMATTTMTSTRTRRKLSE